MDNPSSRTGKLRYDKLWTMPRQALVMPKAILSNNFQVANLAEKADSYHVVAQNAWWIGAYAHGNENSHERDGVM